MSEFFQQTVSTGSTFLLVAGVQAAVVALAPLLAVAVADLPWIHVRLRAAPCVLRATIREADLRG